MLRIIHRTFRVSAIKVVRLFSSGITGAITSNNDVIVAEDNLSEHNTTPRAVVVHDPTRWNALERFTESNGEDVRETLLFQGIPDPDLYQEQLSTFHDTLRTLLGDSQVYYIDELLKDDIHLSDKVTSFHSNPNQVFARDSAFTLPWASDYYIGCNMAKRIRQSEPPIMKAALGKLDLEPFLELPPHFEIEGGDVIPFFHNNKRILLVGHGPRTQLDAIKHLAEMLLTRNNNSILDEIIAIELSPSRINLDGAFCPISDTVALANLESLKEARRYNDASGMYSTAATVMTALHEWLGICNVIEVEFHDSRDLQACNCFCAGKGRVVMYDMCPHVAEASANAGLDVYTVPGTELVKGNGGPRCMTRPIY